MFNELTKLERWKRKERIKTGWGKKEEIYYFESDLTRKDLQGGGKPYTSISKWTAQTKKNQWKKTLMDANKNEKKNMEVVIGKAWHIFL